jgi:hypothetical protein
MGGKLIISADWSPNRYQDVIMHYHAKSAGCGGTTTNDKHVSKRRMLPHLDTTELALSHKLNGYADTGRHQRTTVKSSLISGGGKNNDTKCNKEVGCENTDTNQEG